MLQGHLLDVRTTSYIKWSFRAYCGTDFTHLGHRVHCPLPRRVVRIICNVQPISNYGPYVLTKWLVKIYAVYHTAWATFEGAMDSAIQTAMWSVMKNTEFIFNFLYRTKVFTPNSLLFPIIANWELESGRLLRGKQNSVKTFGFIVTELKMANRQVSWKRNVL